MADSCGVIQNELSQIVVIHSGIAVDTIFGPKTDLTPSNLSHSPPAGKWPLN